MFNEKTKNFINALAVFSGTIIGVGLFGLPYIALKAGFISVFIYFLILIVFVIVFHRLLAEIVLNTEEIKYIPGYIGEYLGKGAKKISLIVSAVGIFGALLAYLIVGGEFLTSYFSFYFGGTNLIYTLCYFIFGAILIFFGAKTVAKIEILMLAIFVAISLILFIKAAPFINLENLKGFNLANIALPYGVILFSLWGLSVVPELEKLVLGDKEQMKKVINWGIIIAGIFYLIFIIAVLGVSGENTSKEALAGLFKIIGDGVVRLGLITIFTL